MMPKTNLRKFLGVKGSGWKKMWPIDCQLEWQGKILRYKWITWRSFDLSKIQGWSVSQEWETQLHKILKKMKIKKETKVRSIFLTQPGKGNKTTEWQLAIPEKDFMTWLYWLIISIHKHSNITMQAERLKNVGLKDSRVGKIKSIRGLGPFEKEHPMFISAAAIYESGGALAPRRTDKSNLLTGDSGDVYKIHSDKKGKGGWGLVVGTERVKWKEVGPHMPIVVKTAQMADMMDGIKRAHSKGTALIREGRLLAAIGQHPNIVGMFDAVATDRCVYVFLEKGEYDLEDLEQGKLNPRQILDTAIAMLSGLDHMHKQRIYHLDIKPENVMIFRGGKAKLIDFGMGICRAIDSKEDAESRGKPGTSEFGGTTGYLPPETWTAFPNTGSEITQRFEMRDSYAAGMTILDGLIRPFYDMKKYKMPFGMAASPQIKKIEYWTKEIEKRLKTESNKIILTVGTVARNMIHRDPSIRATIPQSLDILKNLKDEVQVIRITNRRRTTPKKSPAKPKTKTTPSRPRRKPRAEMSDKFLAKRNRYEKPKKTPRPGKKVVGHPDQGSTRSAFKFFEELERKK